MLERSLVATMRDSAASGTLHRPDLATRWPSTMKPYRSVSRGALPSASGAVLGNVRLPPGRLVVPDEDFASAPTHSAQPCLWVSEDRQPRIAKIVEGLVDAFETTGLWPLVLESLDGDDDRPWLAGELDPASSTDPATHDVSKVVRGWWAAVVPSEEEDDEALVALAPFGRQFPGLAAATRAAAKRPELRSAIEQLSGRLGLVPVGRPADVLAATGWQGPVNHYSDMGALSAVLRSWEERFNAIVVGVGFSTITLAVGSPPSTMKAARAIAAEHFAVCSDVIYQGSGTIEEHAASLVDSRCWGFWWD